MTVILPQFRLAYFAVPKVACTTVKTAIFEAENKIRLERLTVGGRPYPIHRLYPTIDFLDIPHNQISSFQRFALVRDPISRFLSAYRNRVLEKSEIANSRHASKLLELGLPLKPSLSTFIAHLGDYQMVRGISHHVDPLVKFLGSDPLYFNYIADISKIDDFMSEMSQVIGWPLSARIQNGSMHRSGGQDQLSSSETRKLTNFYAQDYEVFGKYFS